MPPKTPPATTTQPDWKERYTALKVRLAAAKSALTEARTALDAADRREAGLRAKVEATGERLRWHERVVLRPEVVAALLPARAAWRRTTAPDPEALRREAALAARSAPYAASRNASAPTGSQHVEIAGLSWWVPRDDRREGRLADRVVAGKWLPLVDILRTREAISNGIMLDVGANIGLTSVTRAVARDVDVVYAAEPAPENYACLVRNVVENGLAGIVLPDQVAISDADGAGHLRLSGSIGGHLLAPAGVEVTTRRLDSWVAQQDIPQDRIRYVKVDTQGRECHVLAGAPALLARSGVVWELEFSPRHLQLAGRSPEELIERMTAAFSHFVDLTPEAPGRRLRPTSELSQALNYLGHSFTNLLAFKTSAP